MLSLFTALCAAVGFATQLTLPSVFSDHMVLQREQPVPVWGTAEPGAIVTVEFAGQTKTATADSSKHWKILLDPMPASSNPRKLTILSSIGNQKSEIVDVLVGEVWLCSGQSNMGRSLKRFGYSEEFIAAATHPLLRFYKTPLGFSAKPKDRINDAAWTTCIPDTAEDISATAFHFGRRLMTDLNVPVGLLQSAWGGTRIEPWIPPCGYEEFDSLKEIRDQIQNLPPDIGMDSERIKTKCQLPTVIYNAMIHAHIPFAIRGAIWYQGESNRQDGMLYLDKSKALINSWRKLWGYDFPFYFVQIAPFQYDDDDPMMMPALWEAQAEIVKQVPNTGMAVVSDKATLNDIHPPNKEAPGTRLALLAEANIYGMNVVCTGPTFRTLKEVQSGSRLQVEFDSAQGLTTFDGKAPDWFEIAGEDGDYKPAVAEIHGNSVIISSPAVLKPKAMRFAWHKLATPNLTNAAGLPAPAFRAALDQ